MTPRPYRIAILQRGISRHRLPFYEALREELKLRNLELELVHGHFAPWDKDKGDLATVPWAKVIRNRVLRIGGREIYWQPAMFLLRGYDLIVVEQANRLLINYLLQLLRIPLGFKLAYWGHGKDFQNTDKGGWRQRFKALYTRHVDWWFAYTDLSRQLVHECGMPKEQITVVQNSADTDVLRNALADLTSAQLEKARTNNGISSENIAVYCGGLYQNKRIPFMLEAARQIREQVADFEFLVIGNGADAELVEQHAKKWPWLHYFGPLFGADRVALMKLAKVQLMPGAVGLGIVDSFLLEVPLVTTDISIHGPEISYLQHEVNGLKTEDDLQTYINAASNLLLNESMLTTLRRGCRKAATVYTVENMVTNFAEGVQLCLEGGK
jgi:glycosyltransferase involved in cell wall biosynthesis